MQNLLTLATILAPLFIGYFIPLPRPCYRHIDKALNHFVYLILALIGLSLAHVDHLDLAAIAAAVALLFLCTSGVNLAALILFDRLRPWQRQAELHAEGHARASISGSLGQLAALALGYLAGILLPPAWQPPERASTYALILLIFLVGLQLGGSGIPLRQVLINRRGVETTLICILSALAGGLLFAACFADVSWTQGLALASGFGWYSLSGIVISEAYGAVWGSVALLNDLLREFFALATIALLMRRHASAAVGIGGATSLDFTLPMIQAAGGISVVPLAISFGFLINLVSPVLMVFFSAWG
ncbi:MAG: lysine exporter LysO family protein [Cardiobacteriaceae bacterium]|nr:lysine exporter LysO family protein [Cardiobacteriaceae bacterium]